MKMADPVFAGASRTAAKVTCIVVHGRGQTQQDMLDLVVSRVTTSDVRFVLPKSDGPGWYLARAVDPLTDDTRRQMQDGIDRITALIAAERAAAPEVPVLLCGFSQGACLAVEVVMRHPGIAAAACLFTACRVGAGTDDLPVAALNGLPVYTSCGDADPWIPATAHHHMIADLTRAGARVRADMFPGRPHEVTDTEIAALSDMLHAMIRGAAIWDAAA